MADPNVRPPFRRAPLLLSRPEDHRAGMRALLCGTLSGIFVEARSRCRDRRLCEKARPMTRERLYLFDTTLRDGAQTTGVDFSLEDKRLIIAHAGRAGRSTTSRAAIPAPTSPTRSCSAPTPGSTNATFTAFGMTKRAGRSVSNDPGFQATLQAKAGAICLVAKAWDYHVRVALGISNEENLEGVAQSVEADAPRAGREAMIDCEHFFDGYKGNRAYALAVATTAYKAGARWVVLCDTNGGTLPHEVARDRRRGGQARAGHAPRHPHPQRHRERGRQHAGGRARRRAADPGRAQRAGRALRQRQPRLASSRRCC